MNAKPDIPARLMAIGEEHGRGFVRALPKQDQIEVCEKFLSRPCPPDVRAFFRSLFLDLTNPGTDAS